MDQTIDQLFVTIKHWLVSFAPAQCQSLLSLILSIAAIIGAFATLFAITTILERKGLGRIQNRYGPNRVGPCGILQPMADGIKAILKKTPVPRPPDKSTHFMPPLALTRPVFLAYPAF